MKRNNSDWPGKPKDYLPAPKEVEDLAAELIDLYHPTLMDASIGLLLKVESSKKDGRVVLGKSRKIPADLALFVPYDFIIWFDRTYWHGYLSPFQQRALVDHQLCHCYMNGDGKPSIEPHDIEEFAVIIQRYGFWQPYTNSLVAAAVTKRMEFVANRGKVEGMDPKYLRFLFDLETAAEDAPRRAWKISHNEGDAVDSAPSGGTTADPVDDSAVPTPEDVFSGEHVFKPSGDDAVDPNAPATDTDILDQVDDLLGGNDPEAA